MQRSSARDARRRVVPRDSPQPVCIIYDHHLPTSRELRSSDAAPPPPDAHAGPYAMRMAAVFTISTATIGLRTSFIPRWLAFSGYAIALVLLASPSTSRDGSSCSSPSGSCSSASTPSSGASGRREPRHARRARRRTHGTDGGAHRFGKGASIRCTAASTRFARFSYEMCGRRRARAAPIQIICFVAPSRAAR